MGKLFSTRQYSDEIEFLKELCSNENFKKKYKEYFKNKVFSVVTKELQQWAYVALLRNIVVGLGGRPVQNRENPQTTFEDILDELCKFLLDYILSLRGVSSSSTKDTGVSGKQFHRRLLLAARQKAGGGRR